MIESMVSAIVNNVADAIEGREPTHKATWNAICLADMGDTGIAFVALPQIPPRNLTWARQGKWVHLAKIAFEKYFLRKMKTGNVEPIYERYVLKALGIFRSRSVRHDQALPALRREEPRSGTSPGRRRSLRRLQAGAAAAVRTGRSRRRRIQRDHSRAQVLLVDFGRLGAVRARWQHRR
jgi:hypothetical protein